MITTNFKLKTWNKKNSYSKKYALEYLGRRNAHLREDKVFFKELVKKYEINLSDETILDLAAGTGMDLKILNEFNPKTLIWHDKMEGVYKVARKNLENLNNIFNLKDLMDLDEYKKNSVKFALCRESLYYIGNDFLFFKELKRILKKEGFFWGKNATLKFYKELPRKSLIKTIRNYCFDWPLYKTTGLRIFAFIPVDPRRLKYIFKKLDFKILYFSEINDYTEFLIKKT